MQPNEDATREHDRAAGNECADDRERLEERAGEDRAECEPRVRREGVDQRLKVRFQCAEA
jgi:hypothetical protein